MTKNGLKIELREMEFDDLKDVFHLGEDLFTAGKLQNLYRTWDEYEVIERYLSDGEYCLVAEVDDRIVGFAIGALIEKKRSAWVYGYLVWVGVDPEMKRFGIGKKLVDSITKRFIDGGARIMIADTSKDNYAALKFFKNIGFDNERDHVYLSKNLTKMSRYVSKKEKCED